MPSLASRIYGLSDAMIEGKTGWMHEAGNANDIADKLEMIFLKTDEMRVRGQAARNYAKNRFEQKLVTKAMLKFYETKLGN